MFAQGSNFIRRSSRGRQVADSRLHSNEEHRLKEWNSNPSLSVVSGVRPPPPSRRDKSSGLIERERLVMVFQGESLLSSRTLKRWYATVNLSLSTSRPVIPPQLKEFDKWLRRNKVPLFHLFLDFSLFCPVPPFPFESRRLATLPVRPSIHPWSRRTKPFWSPDRSTDRARGLSRGEASHVEDELPALCANCQ